MSFLVCMLVKLVFKGRPACSLDAERRLLHIPREEATGTSARRSKARALDCHCRLKQECEIARFSFVWA
ncbi:hypothetical protein GOP47_0024330 [Adiantum capillus-veneris]|uniref:Uncharacterized protein n=1 Tax=Adiantum capillus-veneris TaxID=13818 RepID=A0A9D4U2T6_ADICA|nr:hypothetical protein GOP47_0024330 [Adiantum capillus-veneris]